MTEFTEQIRLYEPHRRQPRIAAIGGGHGLSAMLRGLKTYTKNITAIVTVADDGGGSGMLREDLGMLPPGDIRNCIMALANTEPTMQQLLNYRFTDGSLAGQSFGYLSEDRKRYGLCLNLSVTDNTVLPSLEQLFRGPFVNDGKADRHAQDYVEKIRTKTPNTRARVGSLSGGNQQKVVISKWLLRDCDVLIFDEPTRGIDVGAKSEIYKLMTQLAEEGKAIIMISSDMPELLRLSDRVIVMCEGHVTGELDISEATQESIMTYATKREEG